MGTRKAPSTGLEPLAASASQVGRPRVSDQVIRQLLTKIASGALPRKSKLPTERELASLYGVSTPTIREALRALGAMGVIEVRHGSGAHVAATPAGILNNPLTMLVQMENVGVQDLIGLLRVLNLYVAELAVKQATDEDIATVSAAAVATARCETVEDVTATVPAFLIALVATAHQPLLDAICGFLINLIVRLETANFGSRSPRYWKRWAAETSVLRKDVAAALEQRDREWLIASVNRLHAHVSKRISANPELSRARMSDPGIAPLVSEAFSS
ncbi:FadR/GntR family transcriptional regulator [Streptomyces sp. NPDC056716]|uniref:FadR/GntR family transcriptional regulator n=1 Tax=unclassified Streptomyces TaxID=2593676 RepID=UPI00369A9D76